MLYIEPKKQRSRIAIVSYCISINNKTHQKQSSSKSTTSLQLIYSFTLRVTYKLRLLMHKCLHGTAPGWLQGQALRAAVHRRSFTCSCALQLMTCSTWRSNTVRFGHGLSASLLLHPVAMFLILSACFLNLLTVLDSSLRRFLFSMNWCAIGVFVTITRKSLCSWNVDIHDCYYCTATATAQCALHKICWVCQLCRRKASST